MESTWDKIQRLEMMVDPDQQKWDLSPNDIAAIEKAISLIREFVPADIILEG